MLLKSGALKRVLLVGGLTLAAAGLTTITPVSARTFVSVGVGLPVPGYVAPPPVVYAPPAYAPAPPVVYGPPVAYAAPGYYYGPPVVGGIGVTFGGGGYYHHWH